MGEAIRIEFGSDAPEQIALCLNCPQPKCINCAKQSAFRRRKATYNTPVFQYTPDTMELIREWPTASHAVRELGIAHGSISSAISGRQRTAGGFVWRRSLIETTTEEDVNK